MSDEESDGYCEIFRQYTQSYVEKYGRERNNNTVSITREAMNAISQIMFQYVTTVHAKDLEAFCKHRQQGKKEQQIVMPRDVLLCARKSKSISSKMKEYWKKLKALKKKRKDKEEKSKETKKEKNKKKNKKKMEDEEEKELNEAPPLGDDFLLEEKLL